MDDCNDIAQQESIEIESQSDRKNGSTCQTYRDSGTTLLLNANPLWCGLRIVAGLIWPVTIIPAGHFGPWQL